MNDFGNNLNWTTVDLNKIRDEAENSYLKPEIMLEAKRQRAKDFHNFILNIRHTQNVDNDIKEFKRMVSEYSKLDNDGCCFLDINNLYIDEFTNTCHILTLILTTCFDYSEGGDRRYFSCKFQNEKLTSFALEAIQYLLNLRYDGNPVIDLNADGLVGTKLIRCMIRLIKTPDLSDRKKIQSGVKTGCKVGQPVA